MQIDQLKRREFITLISGAAARPLAARAQQPGKLPLVGVLVSASPPYPFADDFLRGLDITRKARTSQSSSSIPMFEATALRNSRLSLSGLVSMSSSPILPRR